jgi:hypothetical protein
MGSKFGLSFSWKRALGISGLKHKIATDIGIPLTKQGRQRKFGQACGCNLIFLLFFLSTTLILFGAGCDVNQPPTTNKAINLTPVVSQEATPVTTTKEPAKATPSAEPVKTTPSTPVYTPAPKTYTAPAQETYCCKYCSTGKACGDSCISKSYTCHKSPGCACNAY